MKTVHVELNLKELKLRCLIQPEFEPSAENFVSEAMLLGWLNDLVKINVK